MTDNFDGFFSPDSAPTTSGFEGYFAEQDGLNQQRINGVLDRAMGQSADQAADINRLSRDTGLAPDVVARSYQDVKRRQTAAAVSRAVLSDPILSAQLQDPNFAAVAHDDTENLSVLGHTVRLAAGLGLRPLAEMTIQAGGSIAGALRAVSDVQASANPLAYIGDRNNNPMLIAQRLLRGVQQDAANYSKAYGIGSAGNEFSSAGMRGVQSGIESLGQNLLMAPLMFQGTAARGVQLANLAPMGVMQGGQSYGQARDAGQGIGQSLAYAASQGGVEMFTEALPLGKFVEDIKIGSPLWKTLGKQIVAENIGEQAATHLQDLNEWALLHPDQTFGDYLSQRPSAALQALIATTVASGAQTAPLHIAHAKMIDANRAAQAEQTNQVLKSLQQTAEQSKLATRDPDTFGAYMQAVADSADVPSVSIDARAFNDALTAANINPEKVLAKLPQDVRDSYQQAQLTGGDMYIPTGTAVANLLTSEEGNALVPHMKFGDDGMSFAEKADYERTMGAQLQQEIASIIDKQSAEGEVTKAVSSTETKVFDGLMATGRFSQEQARQQASLHGAFIQTMAARTGVTPEEFANTHGLNIQTTKGGRGFFQKLLGNGKERGSYSPETNTVTLTKQADLSTFLHESGHYFLETFMTAAQTTGADESIKTDMATLLTHFGMKDITDWNVASIDEKRGAHENFAQSFEKYLMEGKAPSIELQGIFRTFRAWLVNVYKKLKGIDVTLSPEVRGVMDRMLASTADIQAAEYARNMAPIFESAEAAGMSAEQYKDYLTKAQNASAEAVDELQAKRMKDMKWQSRARSKALKALQREAHNLRTEEQIAATREVMSQPVYQVWQYLTTEEGGKVQIADVAGSEKVFATFRDNKMMATPENGGIPAEVLAGMFGFNSGVELIDAVGNAQPPHEAIADLTDLRMIQGHAELATPEAIQIAADEAIHNELRARVLSTEVAALEHVTKASKINRIPNAVAKEIAKQIVAKQRVRDIRPSKYTSAETRAARAAMLALKEGNAEKAMVEKRNQLLNTYAARAAFDARGEAASIVKYLRALDGRAGALDASYQDQINDLLERFELREHTQKEADRKSSLADWITSQREKGMEPDIDPAIVDASFRTSYHNMTMEELRSLKEAVSQIEHMGRLKKKLLTSLATKDYTTARDEIVASITANAGGRTANNETASTWLGAKRQQGHKFLVDHVKAAQWARIMDGNKDGGPVWEYLIRPAEDRSAQETLMKANATQALSAILAPVFKQGKLSKTTFYPSLQRSLTRQQVLAMALNTGNAGNTQRLLDGYGWNMAQVQPVLDTLTAADWTAVQGIWDHFETYRPEIAAKERRVYGKEPAWVENTPFTAKTADGQTLDLRGGYYPVVYDPMGSMKAEQFSEAAAAEAQLKGAFTSATTRRSFTKERADSVVGRPLLLNFSALYNGVNDVIHDLTWHEWLIDANRLMRSSAIDTAIRGHYGADVKTTLRTWIQDIAEGGRGAQGSAEAAFAMLRQGVSAAGLTFNVMSAMMQPLGYTQSVLRIGKKAAAKGLTKYLGNPIEATKEANAKSTFMAERARTRFRELNELRNQVNGQTTGKELMGRYGYWLMMRFQQAVDVPTWHGAYEKAIGEGNAEDRAVALANQAVIDSQGSGDIVNLATIERGGPYLKLFTTFYSFMNTAMNIGAVQVMTANTGYKKAKLVYDFGMLIAIPAVLGALFKDALTPGDSGDWDDPEKIAKKLAAEEISYLMGLFVVAREFSAAAKIWTGTASFNQDYTGPSGVRVIADTGTVGKQVMQGTLDDSLRKSIINLSGDIFGLPAAQINRTVTGTQALVTGETSNPAAVVFGFQKPR